MVDENAWAAGRTPSPRRDASRNDEYANGSEQAPAPEPQPTRSRDTGAEVNQGNNLHVAGLAQRTKESDLEEIFGKFGKISKVQIMRDPHTRDSRGFAFVNFENVEDADAAMAALNATTLDDKTVTVEKARRGRARTPTPGSYRGPAKRGPERGPPRRDDRYSYDDRRGDRYDDRRGFMAAAPMRGNPDRGFSSSRGGSYYDDRRPPVDDRRYDDYDRRRPYDDRPSSSRYDDRGYDRRPPPPAFDDRRGPAGYGAPPPAAYDAPPRREREREYYDDRRGYRDEPPARRY